MNEHRFGNLFSSAFGSVATRAARVRSLGHIESYVIRNNSATARQIGREEEEEEEEKEEKRRRRIVLITTVAD